MLRNKIVWLILLIAGIIFFHNITAYAVTGGVDYWRRATYAKIISEQWRLPTYEETSEVYDAPLFYFTSGFVARAIGNFSRISWPDALGLFRFLTASLTLVSFWLWTKIFSNLNPKNRYGSILFLLLLASMPVFYRVGAMYVSELITLFWTSLTLYFFISRKNPFVLALLIALGMLTRVSFLAVFFAVSIGLILRKDFKTLITIVLITSLASGWFYLSRYRGSWLNIGYDETNQPAKEKQNFGFYYHIPIKVMLTYPFRPVLSEPPALGPIYYADFWGDYWNYFPQTRFGQAEFTTARANREAFSPARKKYLAWQSRINFIPTLMIVGAMIYLLINQASLILKKKIDKKTIAEFSFLTMVVFTWASLLILTTKYSGQGDLVKASYTTFITPVYIYSLAVVLFSLRKIKFIFWPALTILVLTAANNFIFSWF